MFKKPLSSLKTSAPLRSSDRRKLKQRIIAAFGISSDDGDLLVPDGILSVKFSTHLDQAGVVYLAPDGDPLWFTLDNGSDDLIPTVYTLWKRSNLLPFLSTPAAVIPVLVGGADLMIPGVIHHTPSLYEGQLVSILKYTHASDQPTLSPPLAVGRMALPSDQLRGGGTEKGKAVHVLHTWKDHLWEIGSEKDIPQSTFMNAESPDRPDEQEGATKTEGSGAALSAPTEALSDLSIGTSELLPTPPLYTPQEVTVLLHTSLLEAISSTLSSLPASAFPMSSTSFYTNYILPFRPASPASILAPSGSSSSGPAQDNDSSPPSDPREITIKSSTHKSLTTFLRSAEKASLLTLKSPQKHSQQTDLLITSVNASHPSVVGHRHYLTVKNTELAAAKKALKEEQARESQEDRELKVTELWKPHQVTTELFDRMGGNPTTLYTLSEIRALLVSYINSNSLVNPHDQAYINLDDLLRSSLSTKTKGTSKGKRTEPEPHVSEFMKRDELTKKILEKMQSWYEIQSDGKDAVRKKGPLNPIQVTMKIRQGRKASTLITGFEPFLVVNAEDMAEELRKVCAGATSVSPIAGKPANSGFEVLVQGKQWKPVVGYLVGRGIPKKWIEVVDSAGKK